MSVRPSLGHVERAAAVAVIIIIGQPALAVVAEREGNLRTAGLWRISQSRVVAGSSDQGRRGKVEGLVKKPVDVGIEGLPNSNPNLADTLRLYAQIEVCARLFD